MRLGQSSDPKAKVAPGFRGTPVVKDEPPGSEEGPEESPPVGFNIATNLTAIKALSALRNTQRELIHAFGEVNSGLRIQSVEDDITGSALAETLAARQRSIVAAKRNTHEGIGLLQTAESATAFIGEALKRMRELATRSSTGTLSAQDRVHIDDEHTSLVNEIERIADTTTFNGMVLMSGSQSFDFQVGPSTDPAKSRITVTLDDLQTATLGVDNLDLSTQAGAFSALSDIDSALAQVNGARSRIGANLSRLSTSLNVLHNTNTAVTATESGLRDADHVRATAQLARYEFLQKAGIVALTQAKNLTTRAADLIG